MSERELRQRLRLLEQQVFALTERVSGTYTTVGQGEELAGIVFATVMAGDIEEMPRLVLDYTANDVTAPKLQWVAPGGTAANIMTGNFADNETPGGTVNGSNVTFTTVAPPSPADSLLLVVNGIVQRNIAASGTDVADYSLSSETITFEVAPVTGDILQAWYRY